MRLVTQRPTPVTFGPALSGADHEPLRTRVERCLAGIHEPVRVATLFELADELEDSPRVYEHAIAAVHVLFDLQRIVVFRETDDSELPGVASLIYFLVDGYPLRPFTKYAAAERGRPYRFAFDPATLDLLPPCLRELAPREYCVLELVTGEVLPGRLPHHPRALPGPKLVGGREPPADCPLRPITTDRSLRTDRRPDLGDLVGKHGAVIRQDHLRWNAASLPIATTRVSLYKGAKSELCHGKSLVPGDARFVAQCEALERFQIAYQPPGSVLVRGSYAELADQAVDPRTLFFGRSPECPDDEGEPFDVDAPICWTWAWGVAEQRWRLVPAQEVWFNLPERMSERRFARTTTNGCAVGSSLEEASIHALLEAIERDGLLTSWYLGRPAAEIDFASFESPTILDLADRLQMALPHYRLALIDLTSDIGVPTVGGLAVRERGSGPRVYTSAASHIDGEVACFRALKELTGFNPAMTARQMETARARLPRPESLVRPDDHFDYYALDENFAAFDYLELGRRAPIPIRNLERCSPVRVDAKLRLDETMSAIAARMREVGAAIYVKDLTHPTLAAKGIRAARAVAPGLYPIWFGGRSRRFAITRRLTELAERYTGRSFDRARLRLVPHPMS